MLLSSPADVSAAQRYHLKPGYVSREVPAYYEDYSPDKVWQPDVYRLLRDLARSQRCTEIIDVGCGRAGKLAPLASEFAIVGIDFGSNLEFCRTAYPWGQWVDADLERPRVSLPTGASARRAIVCADVIEHLVDPTGLLEMMSQLLSTATFALISTPERDLMRGTDDCGPPQNPAHVREWNLRELHALLESHGLTVAFLGLTASSSDTFDPRTSLALVVPTGTRAAQRHAIAAQCQALLRTYAAERRWIETREAPDGSADTAETLTGATVLPGLDLHEPETPFGSTTSSVSIVVPVADGSALPEPALRGVLSQTWTDWELLIPATYEHAADLRAVMTAAPSRVRTFTPTTRDVAAVANAGVAAARGRYVAMLDPAVAWDPLFLAAAVAHLDSRPASAVRGIVVFSADTNDSVTVFDEPSLTIGSLAAGADVRVRAMVYNRDVLPVVGGYREGLDTAVDWEFAVRFVRHFDLDVLPLVLMRAHGAASPSGAVVGVATLEQHRQRARLLNDLARRERTSGTPDVGALIATFAAQREHDLRRQREAALARAHEASLEGALQAARTEIDQVKASWRAQRTELYAVLFERLARRLRRAHIRSVVIVGCGEFGDVACRVLRRASIVVAGAGDNNPQRWSTEWNGLSIVSLDDLAAVPADAIVVASLLHATALTRQVRRALRARGETRRIVSVLD